MHKKKNQNRFSKEQDYENTPESTENHCLPL